MARREMILFVLLSTIGARALAACVPACSARARCDRDRCMCLNTGYWGTACTTRCMCDNLAACVQSTGACSCYPGTWGSRCQYTCPGFAFSDFSVCSRHGVCVNDTSSGPRCVCFGGYRGPNCSITSTATAADSGTATASDFRTGTASDSGTGTTSYSSSETVSATTVTASKSATVTASARRTADSRTVTTSDSSNITVSHSTAVVTTSDAGTGTDSTTAAVSAGRCTHSTTVSASASRTADSRTVTASATARGRDEVPGLALYSVTCVVRRTVLWVTWWAGGVWLVLS